MSLEELASGGIEPGQVGHAVSCGADASPAGDTGARIARATDRLLHLSPELSAGAPLRRRQLAALAVLPVVVIWIVLAGHGLAALAACLVPPFLFALFLRVYSLWLPAARPVDCPVSSLDGSGNRGAVPCRDDELPVYTLLVPLFREANVAAGLVAALQRLDYPRTRLDILLITEACDPETRAALVRAGLPGHMRVLVVPEGSPRTKPRALNYALAFARGEYVVVYDAEDEPEPGQLRRALELFARDPTGRIGCVQARLNIYDRGKSWFTRQFTIEYSALFDRLLPALERLDQPVPLGGTSNHFPRHVLEAVGGWDPYNVTEDADLGIRLLRRGWRIGVLSSTTWEEAPPSWSVWLPQRTRWLKGWMQTLLVHTREPARLVAELGARRAAGFVLLTGGLVASALLHPWFLGHLVYTLWTGQLTWPAAPAEAALLTLALVHFLAGYAAAMALGAAAVRDRGFPELARATAWTFLYWLAISWAAHRALYQLVRAPHLWEKTPHTARADGAARAETTPDRSKHSVRNS